MSKMDRTQFAIFHTDRIEWKPKEIKRAPYETLEVYDDPDGIYDRQANLYQVETNEKNLNVYGHEVEYFED